MAADLHQQECRIRVEGTTRVIEGDLGLIREVVNDAWREIARLRQENTKLQKALAKRNRRLYYQQKAALQPRAQKEVMPSETGKSIRTIADASTDPANSPPVTVGTVTERPCPPPQSETDRRFDAYRRYDAWCADDQHEWVTAEDSRREVCARCPTWKWRPEHSPRVSADVANALGGLRHAYMLLVKGHMGDAREFADGLIAPAIQRIEHLQRELTAPASPPPSIAEDINRGLAGAETIVRNLNAAFAHRDPKPASPPPLDLGPLETLVVKWRKQFHTFMAEADPLLGMNEQRRIAGALATVTQARIAELEEALAEVRRLRATGEQP